MTGRDGTVTAFKGFGPGMACRGFTYEAGRTYEAGGTADPDGAIIDLRSVRVDGDTVKADTYYCLRGGELVEEAS